MDRCRFFKRLSAYLDNQLNQKEREKVDVHLKECRLCSLELSRLKALSGRLKEWQAPELSLEFESKVRNEIVLEELERGEVKMKKRTLAVLIPSGVLAGLLVFAFGIRMYAERGFQARMQNGLSYVGSKEGDYAGRNTKKAYTKTERGFSDRLYEGETLTASGSAVVRDASIHTQSSISVPRSAAEKNIETMGSSVIVIQPVLPATGEGEKIIRTATVTVEVEDGRQAYQKASEICQEFAGYLAGSNFYRDGQGRESGTITMRIPKDKFVSCLDKIAVLGKVENIVSNSQDVGQEYANLKTQLDTAMIVYNKVLEALQKRQVAIPQALLLESELTPVRSRIENLKNQIEYLNNAVSFTTITLSFHEPKVSLKVLEETRRDIEEGILAAKINAVKFLAKQLPFVIIAAVLLFVVLAALVLVKYFILRLFKRG